MRVAINNGNEVIHIDDVIKITEDYTGKKYKLFTKENTYDYEFDDLSVLAIQLDTCESCKID